MRGDLGGDLGLQQESKQWNQDRLVRKHVNMEENKYNSNLSAR